MQAVCRTQEWWTELKLIEETASSWSVLLPWIPHGDRVGCTFAIQQGGAEIVLQRSVKVSRGPIAVNEDRHSAQEDPHTVYTSVICMHGSTDHNFLLEAF